MTSLRTGLNNGDDGERLQRFLPNFARCSPVTFRTRRGTIGAEESEQSGTGPDEAGPGARGRGRATAREAGTPRMTALDTYAKLEAEAQYLPAAGAPARSVILNFGERSLVISDFQLPNFEP